MKLIDEVLILVYESDHERERLKVLQTEPVD
jgi:hypothetical protein